MEDPEEAFNRRRQGFDAQGTAAAAAAPPRSHRIEGDVSMEATNGSLDETVRLRQVRSHPSRIFPDSSGICM